MPVPENPESKQPEKPKEQSKEELFKSFIEEYNRNNQKNSDAGRVSAWLELANKYAEMKSSQNATTPPPAENLDEGNVKDILERTRQDDEANINRWKEFAARYDAEQKTKNNKNT